MKVNLRPSAYSAFAYIYVIKKGINSPLLECKHNTQKYIYIAVYREIDIELDDVYIAV